MWESYADKKEKKKHKGYQEAIAGTYRSFVKVAEVAIAENLMQLSEGASVQQVTNTIIGQVYREYDKEFRQKIRKPIKEFVSDIYTNYREQKAPFLGKKIPDAVFNLNDFRTMSFYDRSDNLYLGKFITDKDSMTRINKWVQKEYFEGSLPIGRNSPGIDQFKDNFGNMLLEEDWKIRRVIDTTVNKLRNYGAVSYMQQVGIKSFVVRSIPDNLRCSYCAAMDGKVLSVEIEYEKINTLVAADPSETPTISPFLTATGFSPDDVKEMSSDALQENGIGSGGYHPHCRCTIVIDIQ